MRVLDLLFKALSLKMHGIYHYGLPAPTGKTEHVLQAPAKQEIENKKAYL